jgi:hypothetical protein
MASAAAVPRSHRCMINPLHVDTRPIGHELCGENAAAR